MENIKKLFGITNSEMKDNAFLQGIIIGMQSTIEELEKENKQLKNKKGVWLSPDDITKFRNSIDDLLKSNE